MIRSPPSVSGPQATEGIRSLKATSFNGTGSATSSPVTGIGAVRSDFKAGFSVVFDASCRPHDETTLTDVICETDLTYVGLIADNSGEDAITSLGDLNDDGCDDFAVGAYGEDFANAAGSVGVFLARVQRDAR